MRLRPPLLRRLCRLAAVLALATAGPALAEPQCGGRNVLDEMKQTDADRHARVMAEAAKVENADAILWRIEKAGLAPSWLFGTVHMTDERVTRLSPAVLAALDRTRRVALEVADLSQEATMKAVGGLVSLVIFTDGRRLDTLIPAEDYEKAKAALARAGMPGEMAPMVKPWLVYMLLSLSDCERQRAAKGVQVLDMRLAEEGKKRKAEIVGLETLESQLKAMAGVPEPQQVEMLKASLKFADRTADLMETMLQLYLRRQMAAAWPMQIALAEKVGVPASAFKGFESALVVKRNNEMVEKALPLLARGETFIGVGALHLVGPSGLVAGLRKAGYTVTAIE